MDENGDVRALKEETKKLREVVEELNGVLTRTKGEIMLRGLTNSLVFLPAFGAMVYLSIRLALRKTFPTE